MSKDYVTEVMSAFEEFQSGHKKRYDALQEQMDNIEIGLNRVNAMPGTGSRRNTEDMRAFVAWARSGERQAALVSSDDTKGGYLSPPEFVAELLKNIVRFSPVRLVARVGQTSAGRVELPKRTSGPTGQWVSEVQARPEASMAFGKLTVSIHEQAAYVDVSNQLLEDSGIDLAAELSMAFAEEFGRLEGEAFIAGNGVGKPEGLLTASDVTEIVSGAATAITADGLIEAFHTPAPAYRANATWLMSSATLSAVRKLKDGDGNYLLSLGGVAGAPSATLLGRPILECEDLPAIAAGAYPILFGDFAEGYRIYDRIQLSVLRDPYTQATNGTTRFHARRRLGGAVAKAEAFIKVKVAAS